MDPKLHDYTVFDLETTGKKEKKIIQIGALKVRDDQTVAKFSTYVNPLEKGPDSGRSILWKWYLPNRGSNDRSECRTGNEP